MDLAVPLAAQFIPSVWEKCIHYLTEEIRQSNPKLSVLDGFQLFASCKNMKDICFTDSIQSLFQTEVSVSV